MATTDRGELEKIPGTGRTLAKTDASELIRHAAPERHLDAHTAHLRESIDTARQQISESLDDIQLNLEETLDWRAWVDEHPRELVGIGLALGFYLGVR